MLEYFKNYNLILDCIIGAISMIPLLIIFQGIPYIIIKCKLKKSKKISFFHLFLISIFSFLLASIFVVTGGPSITYIRTDLNINLELFIGLKTNFIQYLLNILLFIPFGMLLPLLWKKYENLFAVVISGFLFSLLIEVGQIFTLRATDIDDLFTNTLGTLIGFILFFILKLFFPKLALLFRNNNCAHDFRKCFNCIMISWCGMFFIDPFLSNWISNILF